MALSVGRVIVSALGSIPVCQSDGVASRHRPRVVESVHSAPNCRSIWPAAVSTVDDLRVLRRMRLGEVERFLSRVRRDSLEGLVMVDALQRLAVDYHFENEIGAILEVQHQVFSAQGDHHEQALRFRLLRQEGYDVSLDIVETFGLDLGRRLGREDILHLTSLHEASHLCMEGEDVLLRSGEITGRLLKAALNKITNHKQAEFVKNTLQHPFHKSLPIFTSRSSRNWYSSWSNYPWNNALLELAHIDSDITKAVYQREVLQITTWWKDLGLGKELRFARDQPVKWYMWAAGIVADPRLSDERVELTKAISLIYIIDDVFDIFGTLDELVLFANSVSRWSPDENLPDVMRACFRALDSVTNGITEGAYQRWGCNPVTSLRKSWGRLVEAFLVEARWFASRTSPTTEEYLRNAVVSSGMQVVLIHVFFLLGKGITERNVNALDSGPGIVSSPATILRLWDDLGSAKDENQDGHDGSYVVYYKQERPGCSDGHARAHVKDLITTEWKKLNKECLFPCGEFPKPFRKACLNAARMVPMMYDYEDDHSLPILEKNMDSLLFRKSHNQEA
ncbi:hypothetical protein MLD38_036951 [Melastoma candidum]|uniref:Uncharacterized protein n=1 Tax=Melastoma candidum TaxID=119954 RepID=A0ACB9LLA9_9MYRT|nr:hypothetical protein MLD38_036951 [Melastoma candidum]